MKIKSGFNGERSLVLPRVIIDAMENDPMTSLLHITDIGYYPKALHHYRRRDPPIDQYVFIYCIDGTGWFELNGTKYEVTENQYFILPPGVPHTYAASDDNPWTIYWVHFKGTKAKHLELPLREVFTTLNDSFAMENIRYAVSAFHYFLESMRYFKLYRRVGNQKHDSDVIESTVHYLEENIERHLSLEEIADYSGFSSSYLSAMFKKRTGYSPLTYFNLLKIRKACALLDTTDMKMNQISFKLGFEDQFYFSRLFSKIMGMSPKAYRSQPKA